MFDFNIAFDNSLQGLAGILEIRNLLKILILKMFIK